MEWRSNIAVISICCIIVQLLMTSAFIFHQHGYRFEVNEIPTSKTERRSVLFLMKMDSQNSTVPSKAYPIFEL